MSSRERTLAVVLLGLIVLGGGGFAAYTFGYEPWQAKRPDIKNPQGETDDLDLKVRGMNKARPAVQQVKRASLPPDINVAKTQYGLLLERLLRQAGITDFTIPDAQQLDS